MSNSVVSGWFLRKSLRCLYVSASITNFAAWISQLSHCLAAELAPSGKPGKAPLENPPPMSLQRLLLLQDSSPLLKSCWRWCSLRVKRWTTFVDDSDSRLQTPAQVSSSILLTIEVAFRTPASSVCQVPFGVCSRHNYLQQLEIYTQPSTSSSSVELSELIHQTAIHSPFLATTTKQNK